MGAYLNRADAAGGHAVRDLVHRGCSDRARCGSAGYPSESKRAGADDRGDCIVPGLSIRIRACLTAFPGVFDSGTEYLMFACWGRLSSMPSKFPTQKFRQQIGLSMNFRIIIDNGAADLTQLLVDFTLPEEL